MRKIARKTVLCAPLFLLILLLSFLVSCTNATVTTESNNAIASTTEKQTETSEMTTTTTTNAPTTTTTTTVPVNPLAWIDNNDLSGTYNLIGDGGRYAYPYGDNILINIQSDMQDSGLNLLNKDGDQISQLNGQTTLQSLLVVDNILFGLDYLDTDSTGINDRLIILNLEKPENTFKLDIYTNHYAFADGRLYFINANDNFRLYSSKPDGSDQKKLTDYPVTDLYAISNQLIIVDESDYQRIKILDYTGNLISSADFAQVSSFAVINKDIYTSGTRAGLPAVYRVSTDLISKSQENDNRYFMIIEDVFLFIDSLCEQDDTLFFSGQDQSDAEQYIWKISSDGNKLKKLSDVKGISDMQLINGILFFRSNEHASMHCIIKTDGTGFKELFSDN